jgi:hypothetical protein
MNPAMESAIMEATAMEATGHPAAMEPAATTTMRERGGRQRDTDRERSSYGQIP